MRAIEVVILQALVKIHLLVKAIICTETFMLLELITDGIFSRNEGN